MDQHTRDGRRLSPAKQYMHGQPRQVHYDADTLGTANFRKLSSASADTSADQQPGRPEEHHANICKKENVQQSSKTHQIPQLVIDALGEGASGQSWKPEVFKAAMPPEFDGHLRDVIRKQQLDMMECWYANGMPNGICIKCPGLEAVLRRYHQLPASRVNGWEFPLLVVTSFVGGPAVLDYLLQQGEHIGHVDTDTGLTALMAVVLNTTVSAKERLEMVACLYKYKYQEHTFAAYPDVNFSVLSWLARMRNCHYYDWLTLEEREEFEKAELTLVNALATKRMVDARRLTFPQIEEAVVAMVESDTFLLWMEALVVNKVLLPNSRLLCDFLESYLRLDQADEQQIITKGLANNWFNLQDSLYQGGPHLAVVAHGIGTITWLHKLGLDPNTLAGCGELSLLEWSFGLPAHTCKQVATELLDAGADPSRPSTAAGYNILQRAQVLQESRGSLGEVILLMEEKSNSGRSQPTAMSRPTSSPTSSTVPALARYYSAMADLTALVTFRVEQFWECADVIFCKNIVNHSPYLHTPQTVIMTDWAAFDWVKEHHNNKAPLEADV